MTDDSELTLNVNSLSNRELLIHIYTKLTQDHVEVEGLKQRVTDVERQLDRQEGWFMGSKFAFWLMSVVPPSVAAYIMSRG